MRRHRTGNFLARRLGHAAVATLLFCWIATPAHAVVETDDFTTFFDYSGGAVTGIWDGSHNMPNLAGGNFFSNMTFVDETLTVDDNGVTNVGWEGNRSTAPFLFSNVPAGQDFTATVKINSQTSGTWSAAGLIARAGNSPTPPGTGTDNADENFVTMYSFRTNAGVPDVGTTLMKRIENGAQVNDIQINANNPTMVPDPANPENMISVPLNPLPTHLRLQRVGGVGYVGSVSKDGGNTFQFQSMVFPTAGNALRDPAVGTEVGLSYMNFGTLSGTTQFDDFTLDTHDPLAAPGAPTLTASQTLIEVAQGQTIAQLITDTSGGSGPLMWARTPTNLPGADNVFPSQGGPPPTVVPEPPANGSYFRWPVPADLAVGDYVVSVTATNAWGQVSAPLDLTIRVVPEPSCVALAGLAIAGIAAAIRRRR